jgi:cytohesin
MTETALHTAVFEQNVRKVKQLLAAGTDANIRNRDGNTPLHRCIDARTLALLIEAGADVNVQNEFGDTPLHHFHCPNMISLLLQTGANPNIQNKQGQAPLHIYESYSHMEAVTLLLQAGANPNIQNKWGRTHLHNCSDLDMANLLLQAGADPNIKDADGKTPLSLAGYHITKDLQKKRMAYLQTKASLRSHCIMKAQTFNNLSLAKLPLHVQDEIQCRSVHRIK